MAVEAGLEGNMNKYENEPKSLSEQSREFLHSDPIGWVVSRNRTLQTALRTGDEELLDFVRNEYACVGKNAEWLVLSRWGDMIDQKLDEETNNK